MVGGQALAFWMGWLGVTAAEDLPVVSRDLDILATASDKKLVYRIAEAISGQAIFPNKRALTALVGQAVRFVSATEYVNVDVIHRVYGDFTAASILERAIEVEIGSAAIKVMHPFDVLRSRIENLAGLPEKQNDLGIGQARAAVEVAREFLAVVAGQHDDEQQRLALVLKAFKSIEKLARSSVGRKVAKAFDVHVADAIAPDLLELAQFQKKKWPQLIALLSDQRAAQLGITRPSSPTAADGGR